MIVNLHRRVTRAALRRLEHSLQRDVVNPAERAVLTLAVGYQRPALPARMIVTLYTKHDVKPIAHMGIKRNSHRHANLHALKRLQSLRYLVDRVLLLVLALRY